MRSWHRWMIVVLAAVVLGLRCSDGPRTYVEPWTRLELVTIPAGEFTMGSPPEEPKRQADETPHRVVIARAFLLSTTEVTQRQWVTVMGNNPSHFRAPGLDAPVEQVTWNEVQEFLRRLNARGNGHYRLPTEAEWEYACRAGSTSVYAFGDRITTQQANYDGRYPLSDQRPGIYRATTTAVASFPANAWGLYDMHGNVWEWCADQYCPYPVATAVDPAGDCGSPLKVIRGGSWVFGADSARSALRYTHAPHLRGFSIGFRVARDESRVP